MQGKEIVLLITITSSTFLPHLFVTFELSKTRK